MGSNNLRFQIIIRITAVALTMFLLFQLISGDAFALTILLVLVLTIVQVGLHAVADHTEVTHDCLDEKEDHQGEDDRFDDLAQDRFDGIPTGCRLFLNRRLYRFCLCGL